MKKIILSACCLITATLANAQSPTFEWVKKMGGTGGDEGNSIVTDASGNVLTTGYFQGTIDFDPGIGTFNLTSLGSSDIFISKLDASGNFVWAKSIGGTSADYGQSITLDASGNIYTTGHFQGTADFDPGAGTFNLSVGGFIRVFILKLDASGNFVWAKSLGGTSDNFSYSIRVDILGNIYTAGRFAGTADFDPGQGTFNLTASGATDIFILKFDAIGNFLWAKQMGGIAVDWAWSVAVSASGDIYTTGYFYGPVDFDPGAGTFNLGSFNSTNIFISKLDASGNFVWAKSIGGTSGNFIAVDPSDNVYIVGGFQNGIDVDPGAGTFFLTSAGIGDIFILKLDASGNFVWVKQIGGTGSDFCSSLVLDTSGDVYTIGSFNGTVDFDPGAGTFNLSADSLNDIFISKIDINGNFVWAKNVGGTSQDYGRAITVNASGNVYTTGSFAGTADFDPGAGIFNLTSAGFTDIFMHKISQCTPPSATITPGGPTTFCSGGSVVLNAPVAANRSYQWKKGTNLISGATLSSYTATTGGNYRVIVTNTVTGCSKTTGSATVVTINTLSSATITPQGPTTFCAGGSVVLKANSGAGLTYKWKKGGNYISGATLLNYTATTAGTYRVEVTNSNGCSKLSPIVTVTVPCKLSEGESGSSFDVKVYPNPNPGEFTIKFPFKPASLIQIELTDELGKVVKRFETSDETVVIKESNLAKGIYCLTARNKDAVIIKKISIVN